MATKKTTKFDRRTVRTILAEVEEALRPVAEKHGIRLERKHCTYHADELPVAYKFLITELDQEGNEMSSDAKEFVRQAEFHGLKPSDLNKGVTVRGEKYRIVGLRPRSRKYPILMEQVRTGKIYKFSAKSVAFGLKAAKAA